MNSIIQLLIEAIFVGISTIIIGNIIGFIISKIIKSNLPEICKDWNKFYIMEISLFLTGFILHILFEILGLNKYYCKSIFFKNKRII